MMSKKESGFTLIEIVMVLVLLGILMAVAAPKYFDLQKEAREQATYAVIAEVQSRVNAEFASQLLNGVDCDSARTAALTGVKDSGAHALKSDEWTVSVTDPEQGSADKAGVTVTWTDGSTAITKDIYLPVCRATTTGGGTGGGN